MSEMSKTILLFLFELSIWLAFLIRHPEDYNHTKKLLYRYRDCNSHQEAALTGLLNRKPEGHHSSSTGYLPVRQAVQ